MESSAHLRSWLFSSLVMSGVLDQFESDGVAIKPPSDPGALQRVVPLEDFSLDVRRNAMRALPAYLAFFCLENSVRELIMERLRENHGADWWEEEDLVPRQIRTRSEERHGKEGKARWHVRRGEHPIYYIDFGDLKNLIITNWQDFEDLLPDQNWVSTRLDELEASRNIIAHSNVLDERELERIRLYLDDWTRQVG